MILIWLMAIPLAGALVAWLVARWRPEWARWAAVLAVVANTVLGLVFWLSRLEQAPDPATMPWLAQIQLSWIPQAGIAFLLAIDGLGLVMVMLTNVLTLMAILASWRAIQHRVGFFHFLLLWNASALIGVFMALDLFLFYFLFELMLVPLYFLIAIWGHERRAYAAIKFFIFTQAGGLLMLVAILGLYFLHGRATGAYTFNYTVLLQAKLPAQAAAWLMVGFLLAFAVKLPVVPLHTWLPDAHTQAPTAGSVILAGLLIKLGAYGMIRFLVPLFPDAAWSIAPLMRTLGVVGILYGALLAYSQRDLKRLVAYTSISHMGFVLLGIFSWNDLAIYGAILQLLAHGLSTGALFMLVGQLEERLHTRDLDQMGGLWATMPRMGGVTLLFALASMGLPGLGNFVAEFLILVGSYRVSPSSTIWAALGLVASTVYGLWIIQRAWHGPKKPLPLPDLSLREMAMMATMVIAILWLGLYPRPALRAAQHAWENLSRIAAFGPKTQETPGKAWAHGEIVTTDSQTLARGDRP